MPAANDHDAPTAPSRDAPADGAALIIIDMINCFDFDEGEKLKARAEDACGPILHLRDQADAAGHPVIYVNDNFGEWHSEASQLVKRARKTGNPVVDRIAPRDGDYFVIKPQYSGFYATNLPVLLPKLGVRDLVLTGIATDMCILFTAADAYMRDYGLWVPQDATAAINPARERSALGIVRRGMSAETRATPALTLAEWAASRQRQRSSEAAMPP
ncbi:isochorismatase family protein [Altererythrobacter xixiisoli]|uniref:Isochorismatase family protein n=1 Tax=Croceibacterium xixiisoli TaxID=1476466 RepID=A0A6I4TVP4_9SPHN|nr:isochorismatase family cysteine hydrolase [Croceibacterium xixiisoli]MXO98403.1 isochorismatase family protein [Croceibacterium xixiisoli]